MMKLKTALVAASAAAGLYAGSAHAQEALEGHGVEISPGTVLHPNLGAEFGVIDNVFYEQDTTVTSSLIRLTANFAIASEKITAEEPVPGEEPANEPAPQTFQFRASGGLRYEEFLYYDNFSTAAQRNLAFDTQAHLQVYPEGTWSFIADDRLTRDIRPRNFEDPSSTNRIDNLLDLGLRYQPGGRSLSGTLRYQNMLDVFEGASGVANRMNHTLGARADWQWLPYTRFFADANVGFFGPLGSAQPIGGGLVKASSVPIRGLVGVATVLSEPLTLKAHAGWAYGSYSAGEGFNGPLFDAELGYAYSPLGRVVLEYNYDYEDSVNANYYRDHKFTAKLDQQIIEKLLVTGGVDLRLRGYRGITDIGMPNRDDVIFSGTARAQYVLTDRYYLTATYRAWIDQTNYVTNFQGMDDPSYTRQEFMAGAHAAF
ncbi:MAG: outer membrane beta-barrel protein [Kofleriaceae bacterium]